MFGYVVPSETVSEILCDDMACRSGDDHNVSRYNPHNKVEILLTYVIIHIRFPQLDKCSLRYSMQSNLANSVQCVTLMIKMSLSLAITFPTTVFQSGSQNFKCTLRLFSSILLSFPHNSSHPVYFRLDFLLVI